VKSIGLKQRLGHYRRMALSLPVVAVTAAILLEFRL
jgi:hypothetical protein